MAYKGIGTVFCVRQDPCKGDLLIAVINAIRFGCEDGTFWCCGAFDRETNTGAPCGISRVFDLKSDFRVCWQQYSFALNGAV